MYCYAENVPSTTSDAFADSYVNYSTLHVLASAIDRYRTTAPWSEFGTIVTSDGDEHVVPDPEQCAKPTIHYQNGKLSFKCATEGVEFVSEVTDADIKKNYTAEVDLGVTYHICVYATKAGYTNSETETASLCWIDEEPQKEGIMEGDEVAVAEVKAGTTISVYDLSGKMLGQTTAVEGMTRVECSGSSGKVVIVKVGERGMKVMR